MKKNKMAVCINTDIQQHILHKAIKNWFGDGAKISERQNRRVHILADFIIFIFDTNP